MSNETSEPTKKLFSLLAEAMNKDRDFAQRATAHVRAISSHNTIINFYNNGSPDEEKTRVFAFLLAGYRQKKYDDFQGQVSSGQAVAPEVEAEKEIETTQKEEKQVKKRTTPQPTPEVSQSVQPTATPDDRKLLETLRALVGPPKVEIDEAKVVAIISDHAASFEQNLRDELNGRVTEYLKSIPPREVVEIRPLVGEKFEIARQHYKFPLLMACLSQRIPVCMVGPAGSSKSTAAQSAAKALGLPFGSLNFGPTTSKADLFGYKDANGNYHSTELVRTALDGGVFCGDEVDNSHAGALVQMNMPLANRIIPTPDGTKAVHDDWVPVFCANTFGTGANRMYVGRNQLDAATLDRMVFIEWDYDPGLEAHCIGIQADSPDFNMEEGGTMDAEAWLKIVRGFRETVAKLGIRHLVTPRAAIYGAKLLKTGVGMKHVQDLVLIKGLDSESINKVKAALKL